MSTISIELEITDYKFEINNKGELSVSRMIKISLSAYLFLLTMKMISFLFESPISVEILIKSLYYLIPTDGLLQYLYSNDLHTIFFIVVPLITVGILIGATSRNCLLALISTVLLLVMVIFTHIIIDVFIMGRSIECAIESIIGSFAFDFLSTVGIIILFSVFGSLVK